MLTEHLVYHLAVLEERERLARELHDHLAQDLGYLKIKAALISDSLDQGKIERAQAQLQELKEVAADLYTDVREEIFSLRSQVSTRGEFLPRLRQYLDEYQQQYKLEIHLDVADDSLLDLPARAGNQLFRIIQEALSNVRKHAQASQVKIGLKDELGHLCLTIEDDGLGFDPGSLRSNGHSVGLKIMEERAESIGARLVLDSSPGTGTRLSVNLANERPVMLQPEL
jgi:signal transduction histidine kinase